MTTIISKDENALIRLEDALVRWVESQPLPRRKILPKVAVQWFLIDQTRLDGNQLIRESMVYPLADVLLRVCDDDSDTVYETGTIAWPHRDIFCEAFNYFCVSRMTDSTAEHYQDEGKGQLFIQSVLLIDQELENYPFYKYEPQKSRWNITMYLVEQLMLNINLCWNMMVEINVLKKIIADNLRPGWIDFDIDVVTKRLWPSYQARQLTDAEYHARQTQLRHS